MVTYIALTARAEGKFRRVKWLCLPSYRFSFPPLLDFTPPQVSFVTSYIDLALLFFFFSSSFHLFLFFFPSFVSSLVPLPLLIDYYRDYLPLNISLFSPFRHNFYAFIVPLRLDVLFTEPLWSSALFPLLFPPPLITPEMIFFCAPLYIYAPFATFLTSVLLSLSLWQESLIYLISFYVSCIHFLVFDYAFYNLLKIFNFFKKLNFFKSNERKIIYLERLLYRITSFSVRDLFLKNRILQAILAIQPVCFTCMMKK